MCADFVPRHRARGRGMLSGVHARHRIDPLAAWCTAATLPAAAYAGLTLATLFALRCEWSLDPQRFCVWWSHSWLPTTVGLPAVLALGWWASRERGTPRPAIVAALLVVLTCLYLRGAAAPVPYA